MGVKRAVSVAAGGDYTLVLTSASVPDIPFSEAYASEINDLPTGSSSRGVGGGNRGRNNIVVVMGAARGAPEGRVNDQKNRKRDSDSSSNSDSSDSSDSSDEVEDEENDEDEGDEEDVEDNVSRSRIDSVSASSQSQSAGEHDCPDHGPFDRYNWRIGYTNSHPSHCHPFPPTPRYELSSHRSSRPIHHSRVEPAGAV